MLCLHFLFLHTRLIGLFLPQTLLFLQVLIHIWLIAFMALTAYTDWSSGRFVCRCAAMLMVCALGVLWVSLQLVTGLFVLLYFLHTANEMSGACSMYGGEERRVQGFSGET
jgi:hypothetical protein